MIRTLILAIKYPKAFLVSLLAKFFGARRSANTCTKEKYRQEGKAIGWAKGDKTVCGITLKEGEEISAEHFYFSRSLKSLKQAIPRLQADGIIFKGTVTEHGCGCGKYLHYLKDRFKMDARGYDVYGPAVKVANNFKDVPVLEKDALGMDIEPCDLIFLSSYLPHIMHVNGFEDYIARLVKAGKQVIAMERYAPDLEKILGKYGFEYKEYGFYIKLAS